MNIDIPKILLILGESVSKLRGISGVFGPFSMGHTEGLRHATRYLFARKFRKHGAPAPSITLRTFRIGDIVDIKVNGALHSGMPNRVYHGATGIVWNVSPHAVGILVKRRVNNHIAPKRIYVRTEHVFPSKSKNDFVARCQANLKAHEEAKKAGTKIALPKRLPAQPRASHVVKPELIQTITNAPFRENW